MALIKCEECGKMISSRAEICPQCGCPVTQHPSKSYPQNNQASNQKENNLVANNQWNTGCNSSANNTIRNKFKPNWVGFICGLVTLIVILFANGTISFGPKLTTPYKDATVLNERFSKCKSPKEIDEVYNDMQEILSLYQQEVYDGKRTIRDVETFVNTLNFNAKSIDDHKALLMEFNN